MKLKNYLKDKIYIILTLLITYLIIILLLTSFKTNISLIIVLITILIMLPTFFLLLDYYKKKTFYNSLIDNINKLDQSYLVLETIKKPDFIEGKILYDALYEINKSMLENVKKYRLQVNDFKDYIEMWIHEVKIPLSILLLLSHNHKNKVDSSVIEQVKKIDDYLEQILYYTRSENANKDYYIKKVNLKKCINDCLLKNKDHLLESDIELIVKDVNYEIYTDLKWLSFILNQIINNSIKYKKKKNCYIKIYGIKKEKSITLIIEDNGIGIPESDLPKVFDKTFTGTNGRLSSKSTGMGLYIAKNLIDKLGHNIEIESKQGHYTKVLITFNENKYYEVVN